MKNLVLLLTLTFGITALYAQDKSAKEYKIEGADAYKAKDYATGLSSFEKAIELYEAEGKTDTTLYFNAAICALKEKDYNKTISFFNRSIELGYKECKARLYSANAYKGLKDNEKMVETCEAGITKCPKYTEKFNKMLFSYYLSQGLDIFNNAAKMQADATPLASTDGDKYKAEMEKVKAEFNKSLPMLEKAHGIDPADENCKKALKQAYEILEMPAKAASL